MLYWCCISLLLQLSVGHTKNGFLPFSCPIVRANYVKPVRIAQLSCLILPPSSFSVALKKWWVHICPLKSRTWSSADRQACRYNADWHLWFHVWPFLSQITMYHSLLDSSACRSLLTSSYSGNDLLGFIQTLRKLCNHPMLFQLKREHSKVLTLALSSLTTNWRSLFFKRILQNFSDRNWRTTVTTAASIFTNELWKKTAGIQRLSTILESFWLLSTYWILWCS